MEVLGTLRIYKHLIEKLKLRYTTMIADGDSKIIKHLNDNKAIQCYCNQETWMRLTCAEETRDRTVLFEEVRKARQRISMWNLEERVDWPTRWSTRCKYSMVVPFVATRTIWPEWSEQSGPYFITWCALIVIPSTNTAHEGQNPGENTSRLLLSYYHFRHASERFQHACPRFLYTSSRFWHTSQRFV